jgi:hypothetical protein
VIWRVGMGSQTATPDGGRGNRSEFVKLYDLSTALKAICGERSPILSGLRLRAS